MDFIYFRIIGLDWHYLLTVLDDYSRYIIAWKLTTSMTALDVRDTLDDTIKNTGVNPVPVRHSPSFLSDNDLCYLSGELKSNLGKIEWYHLSMKNIAKLQN